MEGVSKQYPGVRALDGVSLSIRAGEIHALIGENGAGKSTLIKILTGFERADSGLVRVNGTVAELGTPRRARRAGVSFVPQQVVRVPTFSAGRNILLGEERFLVRRGRLRGAEIERTRTALRRLGAEIDPSRPAAALSVPELRMCQIASTLASPGRIVILDEPTAVLSPHDADRLLDRLTALRDEGHGILYVSHRLAEVLKIADRITVLTNGREVDAFGAGEATREQLVSAMARVRGARSSTHHEVSPVAPGERGCRLGVRGLSSDRVHDVSLDVEPGEIVGLAGVQGSGHGELLSLIANLRRRSAGAVTLDGVPLKAGSAVDAYRAGISLIPADRSRQAILAHLSIQDNIVLGANSPCQRLGIRMRRSEARSAKRLATQLDVRPLDLHALAETLSGGNQQKVALARLLHADVRTILLEEPTQGVDVNGKTEIFELVRALARQGRTVVWASSEFEELIDHADRIVVMSAGRVTGDLEAREASYQDVLERALPAEAGIS